MCEVKYIENLFPEMHVTDFFTDYMNYTLIDKMGNCLAIDMAIIKYPNLICLDEILGMWSKSPISKAVLIRILHQCFSGICNESCYKEIISN